MILGVRPNRGFSLIEVLIALVILSIGLLALAALQATGMRNNHSSYLRGQATLLANDALDRMRANRQSALEGNYVIAIDEDPTTGTVAGDDLDDWKTLLVENLPLGDGAITLDGRDITVTVQWDDSRGEEDPVQFVVETQL